MSAVYTSEANIERYLMVDIAADHSTWVEATIVAVEEIIDAYTNQTWRNPGSSDRYFDGAGGHELAIDACQSVTAISTLDGDGNVEETLDGDDYFTHPYSATVGGTVQPITRLILKTSNRLGHWPRGRKRIKVTAAWGATTIPGPIQLACTILVARVIEKGLKGGKLAAESLGELSLTFEKIDEDGDPLGVRALLAPYRILGI